MPRPISYAVFCLKKKNIEPGPDFTSARAHRVESPRHRPRHSTGFLVPRPYFSAARTTRSELPDLCLFFNDPAPTEIYPLSLHDALPISNNLDMAPPARAEAIPPAIAPNINHLT